jgi:hypothetical protein
LAAVSVRFKTSWPWWPGGISMSACFSLKL